MHRLFCSNKNYDRHNTTVKKEVVAKVRDGERISLRVAYKKLPYFCFCCRLFGHQYKECLEYKRQLKDELPYGAWMKALTKMERVKQKTNQDYWNAKQKSQLATTNHEPQEQQEQRQT